MTDKMVATKPLNVILTMALRKAWKSGSAGFLAGTIQVFCFMWLRTTMNYQVKFGTKFRETLDILWKDGGVARFYRGIFPWGIFQAPLSRFGDVASNEMVVSVMGALFPAIPVGISTFGASMAGACFRIVITPIDTIKTTLQTDGNSGWDLLMKKMKVGGPLVLWQGWEGNYLANVVGNYPWFAVMNFLSKNVSVPKGNIAKLVRSAFLGAVSSSIADFISNSIRVVKTKKQTASDASTSYIMCAKEVIDKDGLAGLFFRGLETRILTNVLQGAFFTILWKALAGTA